MRLAVLATLCFAVPAWAQAPARLSYQGRLLKADGTAEQGAVQITFSLFANAAGGAALWTEQQQLVLTNGFYATHLPSTLGGAPAFPANLFDGTERYLELSVAGNALLPRHRVASVPYALRAGYDSAVVQSRVSSTCSGGQAIAQINADGTVVCSTASAGGVTAVTASAPLTSSGGASPNLAMPAATGSVSGYLASSDWLAFNSKVSSVGAGTATTIGGTASNPTVSVAFGATSTTAVVGNDARLSDARDRKSVV